MKTKPQTKRFVTRARHKKILPHLGFAGADESEIQRTCVPSLTKETKTKTNLDPQKSKNLDERQAPERRACGIRLQSGQTGSRTICSSLKMGSGRS